MRDAIYVVIPGSQDLNRGDQSLVWETVHLAKEAGFAGQYYMLGEVDQTAQSLQKGLKTVEPILGHPSRFAHGKNDNNIQYGISITIKWGFVALFDFLFSSLLLWKRTRWLGRLLCSPKTKQKLELFEQADAFFVKGGGFVHSFGGISAPYRIYFMLYHILLAINVGKDVYVMPNSFGPFRGFLVKHMVDNVFSRCKLVTARESISAAAVSGILRRAVPTFPDLAFYLKSKGHEEMRNLLIKQGLPLSIGKTVAVTVRPYRFPFSKDPKKAYVEYKQTIADFVQWLADEGFFPVFIAHTRAVTRHEDDRSAIQEILELVRDRQFPVIEDNSLDCQHLEALYGLCDYTVGTRFHSVIFSLVERTPSLAITYGGNKGEGIMKDMDLGAYAISIENLTLRRLQNTFLCLVRDEEDILDAIDTYCEASKAKYVELIELLSA